MVVVSFQGMEGMAVVRGIDNRIAIARSYHKLAMSHSVLMDIEFQIG